MKILTLTQPWATLVAIGAKRIETRSWTTDYRGPVAIHAAKTLNGLGRAPVAEQEAALVRLCDSFGFFDVLLAEFGPSFHPEDLPRGQILAVADLADVFPISHHPDDCPDAWHRYKSGALEIRFGDYSHGRYGWCFESVRPLPVPIEWRGMQGLSALEPAMARYIAKEIETVEV